MKSIDLYYVSNGVRNFYVFNDVEGYKKDVIVDASGTSILYTLGDMQYSFLTAFGSDHISVTLCNLSILCTDVLSDDVNLDFEYSDITKFFNLIHS